MEHRMHWPYSTCSATLSLEMVFKRSYYFRESISFVFKRENSFALTYSYICLVIFCLGAINVFKQNYTNLLLSH